MAKNIACTWDTEECETYIEKLMQDDRGDRLGFPKSIFNILLSIYLKHGKEPLDVHVIERYAYER